MIKGQIEFIFNSRKTVEAVLYIANKLGGEVDTYKLLKIIFAADKYRLNNHAHSVTGDLYISGDHGTVPISLNEIIEGKKPKTYLKDMELKKLPFKITKISKDEKILSTNKKPDRDYLSNNDIKSLDKGIEEYGSLSREAIENKNHKEKCWKETERGEFIPFELIIKNDKARNYLLEHPYGIVV